MTNNKCIFIKNVYYMLTYAFRVLRQSNYDKITAENFDNIHDLFASILSKGIAQQLKQGLCREYISKCKNLSSMRGKINIQGTINNKLQRKQMLACEYDELSVNNTFNQIIKRTAIMLLNQPSVSVASKTILKKEMLYFHEVDFIDASAIQWNKLQFQKNNHSYKMLINICYFVLNSLLLTTEKGAFKLASFLDDQSMAILFEKFVLKYFQCHHGTLKAAASQISWNVDDGVIDFLPIMQTDITLSKQEKILIIDTKYYSQSMQVQERYDSHTIHSNNLYQIFAYVKNKDIQNTGNVSG
ncbi:MAG: 5-methylcytosine-specific restriction endonuclease system specificity protein McrC, partial [Caldisericia bacterium]|nr:5-methylcytosine-specific restriction endonuclease system specificity protein McrC [Caldisericia bacterium]